MQPFKKSNYFQFFACVLLFSSCLTAKKIDRQVAKKYADRQEAKKPPLDDITVTSHIPATGNEISTTNTKTSHFLPLLLYWSWDYKNTCTLNPQIPLNHFKATVAGPAGKLLREKLNGRHLELSVGQMPNKFAIDDKAHVIFLVHAFSWDNVSIKAEPMDMVITYSLVKDSAEVKKGIITIPYDNDKMRLGWFKSWKKATNEYLDRYDANITAMSRQMIGKLLTEL